MNFSTGDMYRESTLEMVVLKRDRTIVITGIAGISVTAWAYMFYLAFDMRNLETAMSMPHMQSWSAVDFIFIFAMWAVMMVAMMVPSTAPMVLMFVTINRKRQEHQDPIVSTGVFLLGYLTAWTGYSALATVGQWKLHAAAFVLAEKIVPKGYWVNRISGLLLIAWGVWMLKGAL